VRLDLEPAVEYIEMPFSELGSARSGASKEILRGVSYDECKK